MNKTHRKASGKQNPSNNHQRMNQKELPKVSIFTKEYVKSMGGIPLQSEGDGSLEVYDQLSDGSFSHKIYRNNEIVFAEVIYDLKMHLMSLQKK